MKKKYVIFTFLVLNLFISAGYAGNASRTAAADRVVAVISGAESDGVLDIYSVNQGRRCKITSHSFCIKPYCVRLSPDGKLAAVDQDNNHIAVYNTSDAKYSLYTIETSDDISDFYISNNGKIAVVTEDGPGDYDGQLIIYQDGKRDTTHNFLGSVLSVRISPNGRWVAVTQGDDDYVGDHIAFYDTINPERSMWSKSFSDSVYDFAVSDTGSVAAIKDGGPGDYEGQLLVFDVFGRKCTEHGFLNGDLSQVAVSSDSSLIAVLQGSEHVAVYKMKDAKNSIASGNANYTDIPVSSIYINNFLYPVNGVTVVEFANDFKSSRQFTITWDN